jgi:hypothetical protein
LQEGPAGIGSGIRAAPTGTGMYWARAGTPTANPAAISAAPIHLLTMFASPFDTPRIGNQLPLGDGKPLTAGLMPNLVFHFRNRPHNRLA